MPNVESSNKEIILPRNTTDELLINLLKDLLHIENISIEDKVAYFIGMEFKREIKPDKVNLYLNKELSEILERIQKNELNWKYDEEFWNEFILKETKNV